MKNLIKVLAALMLTVIFIGCGEQSSKKENIEIENISIENAPTFKEVSIVKDGGRSYLVFNKNKNALEKKAIKRNIRTNTLSGKLALQSYMYDNMIDYYNTYIYDKEGNFYELTDQLIIGEEYTINSTAINNKYNVILSASESFVMTEDDINIELSFEITTFLIDISNPTENIDKVYDSTFDEIVKFYYDNGNFLNFQGYVGNKYYLNDNIEMDLSYTNVYNLFAFNIPIPTKNTGGILSVGFSVNNISYTEAQNGILMQYDEKLEKGVLRFNIKVDEDCFLYFSNDYNYQNDVTISINRGNNDTITEFDGALIPKGSYISVTYINSYTLDYSFHLESFNPNKEDDELTELLNNILEEEEVKP